MKITKKNGIINVSELTTERYNYFMDLLNQVEKNKTQKMEPNDEGVGQHSRADQEKFFEEFNTRVALEEKEQSTILSEQESGSTLHEVDYPVTEKEIEELERHRLNSVGNFDDDLPIVDSVTIEKDGGEFEEVEKEVSGLECDSHDVGGYEQYLAYYSLDYTFPSIVRVECRIGQLRMELQYYLSKQNNLSSEEVRRMVECERECTMHELFAGQFFGGCLIGLLPKCKWVKRYRRMYIHISGLYESGFRLRHGNFINPDLMANSVLVGKKPKALTDFLSRASDKLKKSV